MSYARIIEDGCYIYPEIDAAGIRIMFFPNEELDFIPDNILDVILSKMSDAEIKERKEHGEYIRSLLLLDNKYSTLSKNKNFFEWRKNKNV